MKASTTIAACLLLLGIIAVAAEGDRSRVASSALDATAGAPGGRAWEDPSLVKMLGSSQKDPEESRDSGDLDSDSAACTNGANGQPCQNGGSAEGTTGRCDCSCATGYSGANCQTAAACTNGANGQACQNGGSVTGTTGSCGCSCATGYSGANCGTSDAPTPAVPTASPTANPTTTPTVAVSFQQTQNALMTQLATVSANTMWNVFFSAATSDIHAVKQPKNPFRDVNASDAEATQRRNGQCILTGLSKSTCATNTHWGNHAYNYIVSADTEKPWTFNRKWLHGLEPQMGVDCESDCPAGNPDCGGDFSPNGKTGPAFGMAVLCLKQDVGPVLHQGQAIVSINGGELKSDLQNGNETIYTEYLEINYKVSCGEREKMTVCPSLHKDITHCHVKKTCGQANYTSIVPAAGSISEAAIASRVPNTYAGAANGQIKISLDQITSNNALTNVHWGRASPKTGKQLWASFQTDTFVQNLNYPVWHFLKQDMDATCAMHCSFY